MFARAALFCIALMAAAVSIAFVTTPRAHTDAELAYTLCAGRTENAYRLSLPPTPEEELLLAAGSTAWQRRQLTDEDRTVLTRLTHERCGEHPARDRPEVRAALNLAVLVGGGVVLYATAPYRQILLRRLLRLRPTPATGPDAGYRPDLAAAVYRQAADAGVTLSGVWLDAGDYTQNALAFGHWRRRHIELASGMADLFDEDPDTFAVIVRHELGHIRNRDVDVTFAVTALWGAFVVLVAAVLGYSLSGRAAWESGLRDLGYRLLVLGCLVIAARNTYLHAREFHADAYAAAGPGGTRGRTARASLDRFLLLLAGERSTRAAPRRGTPSAAASEPAPSPRTAPEEPPDPEDEGPVWPFATHPPLARRRAVLADPARADEPTAWEAALIGCVAMFTLTLLMSHSFDVMLYRLHTGDLELGELTTLRPVYAWLALPLLLPAGTVLGRGVWACVVAAAGRRSALVTARLAGLAGGLWAGLALGALLLPPDSERAGWPGVLTAMWWRGSPGSTGIGLAATAALTVALTGLLAVACRTLGPRRWTASLMGGYGTLVTAAWFPSALPAWADPYLYTFVLALPLGAGALALAKRDRRPAPVTAPPPAAAPPAAADTRREPAAPAGSRRRTALAHAVTLATVLAALAAAGRLLAGAPTGSLLVLTETLGLLLYVLSLVGAVLARHRAELGQRLHTGAACLMAAALLLTVDSLFSGAVTPLAVLLVPGLAGGVIVAGRTTADQLHGLRIRNRAPATAPARARGRRH